MTTHRLQGRTEEELFWFRRRGFLQGASAWIAMGGFGAAVAQTRSNIVSLTGDAMVNGQGLRRDAVVQSGDRVETGPGSNLVFVIGNSAFQVRQNSRVTVERGQTLNAVSVLRLVTGAVASVWGKGNSRLIVTPTLTAGIRGTGVYTEVFADQGDRSYFCNCYGVVELASTGRDRALSEAEYHQSFWGEVQPRDGRLLTPAPALNHTDEELETLAKLVDQSPTWVITGRKGNKADSGGSGYGSGYGAAPAPASGGHGSGYGATPAPAPASGGYGSAPAPAPAGGPTGGYR